MKRFLALFAILSVLCSLSAQKVNENIILFGKEQLTGFTINIDNATKDIVEGALADKFEKQFGMKSTSKKGFRVYENQNCSAFGDARYDIYFNTVTVGKKKNQATQLTLVVSTGNMNFITFANDPRTSRNIVAFLENLPNDVEAYKTLLRIKELEKELTTLKKERESLEKDKTKLNDKIAKANDDIKKTSDRIDKKSDEILKLQDEFNNNHDASVKDQISQAVKDKQSMQKTNTNTQKSLLKLNENIVKLNKKLETNAKSIEKCESELKTLKEQYGKNH